MAIARRAGALLPFSVLATLGLFAGSPEYRSVSIDKSGQLHIRLSSGGEILPEKIRGQVSFADVFMSPDRRTVGWLVMYPSPIADYPQSPIAGKLVIYRAGRVLHTFSTEQVFWDWQFQAQGAQVAYCTGPLHGGAAECVLRRIGSGQVGARWVVRSGSRPPSWALTLRY